jgi:hypothetical protein
VEDVGKPAERAVDRRQVAGPGFSDGPGEIPTLLDGQAQQASRQRTGRDGKRVFLRGDRKPSTALYLLRRPRAMWVCMPDDPVEKIWAADLKRGKKIAKHLRVEVLTGNTAKNHFEKEKEATLDRKKAVEGRSFIRSLLDQ